MRRDDRIEAEERIAERRRRENAAPRLRMAVSQIGSLSLEIEEYMGESDTPRVRYTRHIVVERAPAIFFIGCTEVDCSDGGHDVTVSIMAKLRSSSTDFTGEDRCYGNRFGKTCGARLKYRGHASYQARDQAR